MSSKGMPCTAEIWVWKEQFGHTHIIRKQYKIRDHKLRKRPSTDSDLSQANSCRHTHHNTRTLAKFRLNMWVGHTIEGSTSHILVGVISRNMHPKCGCDGWHTMGHSVRLDQAQILVPSIRFGVFGRKNWQWLGTGYGVP